MTGSTATLGGSAEDSEEGCEEGTEAGGGAEKEGVGTLAGSGRVGGLEVVWELGVTMGFKG